MFIITFLHFTANITSLVSTDRKQSSRHWLIKYVTTSWNIYFKNRTFQSILRKFQTNEDQAHKTYVEGIGQKRRTIKFFLFFRGREVVEQLGWVGKEISISSFFFVRWQYNGLYWVGFRNGYLWSKKSIRRFHQLVPLKVTELTPKRGAARKGVTRPPKTRSCFSVFSLFSIF